MTDTGFDPGLLPAAADSPRCAEHSTAIALDPGGSALHVDEVFMIDVPLPWPKPVWAAPGFTHIPEAVMAAADSGRRVRALAAVPVSDGGAARIVAYERVADVGPLIRHEWAAEPSSIGVLADALLRGSLSAADDHRVEFVRGQREIAICTQGSHDICCGAEGMRLVEQLLAVRPGLSVRKVSHTGGHRYAPTGLTFPDGRMWGFVSLAEMVAIIDRDASPATVAGRCRGWMGADAVGQVAERAVFASIDDWAVDDVARDVRVTALDDGWACEVVVAGRRFDVQVARGRAVPTISCRAEGGLPAKPGKEYSVRSCSER